MRKLTAVIAASGVLVGATGVGVLVAGPQRGDHPGDQAILAGLSVEAGTAKVARQEWLADLDSGDAHRFAVASEIRADQKQGELAAMSAVQVTAADEAARIERERRERARQEEAEAWLASRGGVSAHLERIARCESGGNPRAVSANGLYRGKYQFAMATWRSLGGVGDPIDATEAEQDMRAQMLYERSGPGQWPVCSRR